MYGLVNQGMQDLVVQLGGDLLWAQVKQQAGVDLEAFVGMEVYPDDVTSRLVAATTEVMRIPAADVLRTFGRHWILYTGRRGYGAVFEMMGRTLPAFLANLDAMHARLSLSLPHLEPPSFVCEQFAADRMRLAYYSHRSGLAPMVIGLLDGLGELFGLQVRTVHTLSRDDGHDHDEFEIETSPITRPAGPR